jgi:hypothetical protein
MRAGSEERDAKGEYQRTPVTKKAKVLTGPPYSQGVSIVGTC